VISACISWQLSRSELIAPITAHVSNLCVLQHTAVLHITGAASDVVHSALVKPNVRPACITQTSAHTFGRITTASQRSMHRSNLCVAYPSVCLPVARFGEQGSLLKDLDSTTPCRKHDSCGSQQLQHIRGQNNNRITQEQLKQFLCVIPALQDNA
jgi:hypothetical protein